MVIQHRRPQVALAAPTHRFGAPSRTALATAYARAFHQIADTPRIFTDPLAARILSHSDADLRRLRDVKASHPAHPAVSNRVRRLYIAARAQFAEDLIAEAAARGTSQVVILGAGLDTFAYRNTTAGQHVFEVDEPITQSWKRRHLAAAGIRSPSTVTFVPVDFETQEIQTELARAGFRCGEAAIFVWMGVTMYLTTVAIEKTLRFIAAQAPPTEVVLDYIEKPTTAQSRSNLNRRARKVASLGEPWHSFFDHSDVAETLCAVGLTPVIEHGAADLIASYAPHSLTISSTTDTLPRVLHAARA